MSAFEVDGFDPSRLRPIRTWLEQVQPDPSSRRVSSFVTANTTSAGAAALSAIFFPRFTIYRDCYLIDEGTGGRSRPRSLETVDEWIARFDGDREAAESMINHLHIGDLYINDPDVDAETLDYLADVLAFSWKVSAHRQFPRQRFETRVEHGIDPEVTVYAVRS